MKLLLMCFTLLVGNLTFAKDIYGDDRSISGLGDDERLVFLVPNIQKGSLKPGAFSSEVNFKVRVQLIQLKSSSILPPPSMALGSTQLLQVSAQAAPLKPSPVNGVIKLDGFQLNSILSEISNPDSAELKISLIQDRIMNVPEIQTLKIDIRTLKNDIISRLSTGQSMTLRLRNGGSGAAVDIILRIEKTPFLGSAWTPFRERRSLTHFHEGLCVDTQS